MNCQKAARTVVSNGEYAWALLVICPLIVFRRCDMYGNIRSSKQESDDGSYWPKHWIDRQASHVWDMPRTVANLRAKTMFAMSVSRSRMRFIRVEDPTKEVQNWYSTEMCEMVRITMLLERCQGRDRPLDIWRLYQDLMNRDPSLWQRSRIPWKAVEAVVGHKELVNSITYT